jgi:hypothetical protein
MSESPINLDELLDKGETIIEETTDSTAAETTAETITEDINSEDNGVVEDIENNELQKDEALNEENTSTDLEESNIEVDVTPEDQIADTALIDESDSKEIEDKSEKVEYKFKDDFIKKAVDYYEKFGTLQPFLEATKTNYDTVADIDILKMNFEKENSDLSPKAQARLFEKELEKYNLEAFDDEDAEIGQALLKRDANKLRVSLKENQKEFLESVTPLDIEPEISAEQQESEMRKSREIVQDGISNVLKNNLIKVEANGEGINFQIDDANKVVDYALDQTKFLSTFAKDGQIDWAKWTKVVAFAENPTLFVSELIKHGKSLGRKMMESELKNATPELKSKDIPQTERSDNPYDDKIGFLKEMKVIKK